jgi:hypothetical protein
MSIIGGFSRFFETARTAVPGEAPETKKKSIKKSKKSQMNQK